MKVVGKQFAPFRAAYQRSSSRLSSCYRGHSPLAAVVRVQKPPHRSHLQPLRAFHSADNAPHHTAIIEEAEAGAMDERKSVSATSVSSAGKKRKRPSMMYYAVRAGHKPGIYYSYDDVKAQIREYSNSEHKSFKSLSEAEAWLSGDNSVVAKTSQTKWYGVQIGHEPGVYTDYNQVQKQVKGCPGAKQQKFATREEAQAFVDAGKADTTADIAPVTPGAAVNIKNEVDTEAPISVARKGATKKQKRNDESAAIVVANGDNEPGYGPLPPDAEDGFDRGIMFNPITNRVENKTDAQLNAMKAQPTGEFTGVLKIWTDGSTLGNGKKGAVAGVGVYFGPNDPRNASEGVVGERQTNQRAELVALGRAIDIAPINQEVLIYSDSNYAIKCVTEWFLKWKENNWRNAAGKQVENRDVIEPILNRINERMLASGGNAKTNFQWVKGHGNDPGNVAADSLARNGARRALAAMRTLKKEQKHEQSSPNSTKAKPQIGVTDATNGKQELMDEWAWIKRKQELDRLEAQRKSNNYAMVEKHEPYDERPWIKKEPEY